MSLERREDGLLVTRLHKILSLAQAYTNEKIPQPVEDMTIALDVAPLLFKEATKPTSPRYRGTHQVIPGNLPKLPHVSQVTLNW